jgi:hypothetical protein
MKGVVTAAIANPSLTHYVPKHGTTRGLVDLKPIDGDLAFRAMLAEWVDEHEDTAVAEAAPVTLPVVLSRHVVAKYDVVFDGLTGGFALGSASYEKARELAGWMEQALWRVADGKLAMVARVEIEERDAKKAVRVWRKVERIQVVVKTPNPHSKDYWKGIDERRAEVGASEYEQVYVAPDDGRLVVGDGMDIDRSIEMAYATKGRVSISGEDQAGRRGNLTTDKAASMDARPVTATFPKEEEVAMVLAWVRQKLEDRKKNAQ